MVNKVLELIKSIDSNKEFKKVELTDGNYFVKAETNDAFWELVNLKNTLYYIFKNANESEVIQWIDAFQKAGYKIELFDPNHNDIGAIIHIEKGIVTFIYQNKYPLSMAI